MNIDIKKEFKILVEKDCSFCKRIDKLSHLKCEQCDLYPDSSEYRNNFKLSKKTKKILAIIQGILNKKAEGVEKNGY